MNSSYAVEGATVSMPKSLHGILPAENVEGDGGSQETESQLDIVIVRWGLNPHSFSSDEKISSIVLTMEIFSRGKQLLVKNTEEPFRMVLDRKISPDADLDVSGGRRRLRDISGGQESSVGIEKFHIVSCAPEERRRESLVPCVLNGSNANDASNVTFLPRKVPTRCHETQIRYVGIATGFNLGGVIYSIVLLSRSKQRRTHSLLKVERNDVDAIIVLIIMQLLCCAAQVSILVTCHIGGTHFFLSQMFLLFATCLVVATQFAWFISSAIVAHKVKGAYCSRFLLLGSFRGVIFALPSLSFMIAACNTSNIFSNILLPSVGTALDRSGLSDSGLSSAVPAAPLTDFVSFKRMSNATTLVKCRTGVSGMVFNFHAPPLPRPAPESVPTCQFWDVANKSWSTEGCHVEEIRENEVVCACSHLTDFGVGITQSFGNSASRIASVFTGSVPPESVLTNWFIVVILGIFVSAFIFAGFQAWLHDRKLKYRRALIAKSFIALSAISKWKRKALIAKRGYAKTRMDPKEIAYIRERVAETEMFVRERNINRRCLLRRRAPVKLRAGDGHERRHRRGRRVSLAYYAQARALRHEGVCSMFLFLLSHKHEVLALFHEAKWYTRDLQITVLYTNMPQTFGGGVNI